MGRKAFGPSKKKACDFKKCLKKKKEHAEKQAVGEPLLHPRAF